MNFLNVIRAEAGEEDCPQGGSMCTTQEGKRKSSLLI